MGNCEDLLPLSEATRARLEAFSVWHDTALNRADPPDSGAWTEAEGQRFEAAALEALEAVRADLGPPYEVVCVPLWPATPPAAGVLLVASRRDSRYHFPVLFRVAPAHRGARLFAVPTACPSMRLLPLLLLLCTMALAGCTPGVRRADGPASAALVPVYADTALFRTDAQAFVDAFAAEVGRARGAAFAGVPTVEVRNTPQLIFYSGRAGAIVVPWWETQPAEMRAVFRTFAGGGDAEAEHLFRAFFNRFLIAHEAAHWFQARADRRAPTLYENEDMANRIAVAFWRTQPGGERLLAELERLAVRAAANLPDPTPPGEDPVAYFGANYQALGRDPLKYGYYQFRFMADALRDRARLDFARIVGEGPGR